MEKPPAELLKEGLSRLGLRVDDGVPERLWAYAEELLKWNAKVNLTAITAPREVVEKHLLDSLTVLPEVAKAQTLLDLGAGAGLPGIPLAIALPQLRVVMADAVGKKVAFMKSAAVKVGVQARCRAEHLRAEGKPDDGLGQADVVISRALMDVGPWLALAAHYLAPNGTVVAMLGRAFTEPELDAAAAASHLTRVSLRTFELPFSRDRRAVAAFRRST